MNEELLNRITIEPGKCGGKPCIRGYRIRVRDVHDLLSTGASHEEILRDYDSLEKEDILAAIAYAGQSDQALLWPNETAGGPRPLCNRRPVAVIVNDAAR